VGCIVMSKATQRTLAALKEQGALCGMVERFNQFGGPVIFKTINGKRMGKHTGVRQDLFGIIDIIALYPDRQKVCGIQSCGTAFSEHLKKIKESSYSPIWIKYADLELWGWRKLKSGWAPRIHRFTKVDWL